MDEAIADGIKALHKGTEGKLNPDATEIGIVDKDFQFPYFTTRRNKRIRCKGHWRKLNWLVLMMLLLLV